MNPQGTHIASAAEGAEGSAPEGEATVVAIGERLRLIRLARRLSLKELAERCDLSESFLSQVERGRANASIASMLRISKAIGVTMADLFEDNGQESFRVLRSDDRRYLEFGTLGRKALLTPATLQHVEMFVGEFAIGGSTGDQPYAHGDSEEVLMVLDGRIEVQLGEDIFEMRAGDAVSYRSSTAHRARNVATEKATVLWVISPPSY